MSFFRKYNKVTGLLAIALALFMAEEMFLLNTLEVQAAEFKHSHAGSCYTTGTMECTANHSIVTKSETVKRECKLCGVEKEHISNVYYDVCARFSVETEVYGVQKCKTCGEVNHSWGKAQPDPHMVETAILSCGKNENDTSGELWIKNTTPEWTTGEVTLNVGVNVNDRTLIMADSPYSWDGGGTWSGVSTRKVNENGTYTVYGKTARDAVVSESVKVTNIDRTAPVINSVNKNTEEWTNKDITITLQAVDVQPDGSEGCGMATQAYSYDGGKTYTGDNKFTVGQNGTYDIMLADKLNNINKVSVKVSNIDKTAPVIKSLVPDNTGWHNGPVTMAFVAEDNSGGSGLHEKAYSVDGINWYSEAELPVAKNGEYTAYVRDAAGNIVTKLFKISEIDITAPQIQEFRVYEDDIWQDKVRVTIVANDLQPDKSQGSGLHEKAYSIDGGKTWQSGNTFMAEEGKSYDVRVRDRMLWESKARIVTRKDFPYPSQKEETTNPTPTPEPETNPTPVPTPTPEITPEAGTETAPEFEEEPGMDEESDTEEVLGDSESEEDKKSGIKKTAEQKEAKINLSSNVIPNVYVADGADISEEKVTSQEETYSNKTILSKAIETEVTISENMSEDTGKTVKVIRNPWYSTAVGKTAIISMSTLLLGSLLGIVMFVLLFGVRVYCVEGKNSVKKLGSVLLHRTKEGYSVYLPELLLKSATVPRYRMKISPLLLKRVENARLLVESDEKNLEVLMQESIDFEL